jgi:hypothetical protein
MDFQAIRSRFEQYVKENEHVTLPPQGIRGAGIAVLEKACGGKENRYLITKALTGKIHTADLSAAEWSALLRMIDPNKNPMTNKWEGRENLAQMCGVILTHVAEQAGQMTIFEPQAVGRIQELVEQYREAAE